MNIKYTRLLYFAKDLHNWVCHEGPLKGESTSETYVHNSMKWGTESPERLQSRKKKVKICNWESINIPSQKTVKPILDLLLFTYSYYLREPCTTTVIFSIHKSLHWKGPLTLHWWRIFTSTFTGLQVIKAKVWNKFCGVHSHFLFVYILTYFI